MLNSFQLKLVKFTENEQNKNEKPLQAHHVTAKTGQKKQQYKFKTKTLQAHHVALSSIISSPTKDCKFKSKESQSYIIINTITQSQFHTETKTKYGRFV